MSDKQAALSALDAEFNSLQNYGSGRLKIEEYYQRRTGIEEQPELQPALQSKSANGARDGVSWKSLSTIMETLVDSVLGRFKTNEDKIAEFERRISALESKPSLKYAGTWSRDIQCNEGEFVTDKGSVWYCNRSTRGRPGECEDYQLAVKKGRDGR